MISNNLKISDIKVVDEITLYKFDEVIWSKVCLRKQDNYIMISKQHGDYFEIKFLSDAFYLEVGDNLQVVAQPAIDIVTKDYIKLITDLMVKSEQDKTQRFTVNFNSQTCYFDCSDEQWDELFKTADKELINTNIDSKKYNHFHSEKNIRLVRIEKEIEYLKNK